MPLALNKIRSIKFTSALDLILYLLENITEEKFWQGILGERLTRLGQRYFGNDFVVIGILFYIAPILRTNWQNLVELCMERMAKRSKTISVRVYYYDEVYNAINYYVLKNTEQISGLTEAVAMYEEAKPNNNNNSNSDDEKKKPKIGFYPRINTTNEITYNGYKLSVSTCNDNEEKATSNRPDYLDISMETTANDSIDSLKNILQDWCDLYNDNEDNTIKILRWDGYESWIFKDSKEPRGYDSVNLPSGVKENLLADMTRFMKREKWYRRKGLPHRRGFLLYGPPGTGKTSLIQALAGKLKFDLALVKLGEVRSDSEFSLMVSSVPKETLLVIEDVDHYDESNTDSSVSKSGLLNGLDGINGNDGTMVFMTCNDMNKITPALLRPGRMDVKLELGYAVHYQMEAMFWRFFGSPDLKDDDDDDEEEDDEVLAVKNNNDKDMASLLPTPPNEEENQERKTYLESNLKKLLTLIPEHHVTTAELQNLFVTLFLEVGTDQVDEKVLLERLVDRIPDFLERVQLDREQAKLHDKLGNMDSDDDEKQKKKKNKNKKKDNDDDDDTDTSDDTDKDDDTDKVNDSEKIDDDTDKVDDSEKVNNDADKMDDSEKKDDGMDKADGSEKMNDDTDKMDDSEKKDKVDGSE